MKYEKYRTLAFVFTSKWHAIYRFKADRYFHRDIDGTHLHCFVSRRINSILSDNDSRKANRITRNIEVPARCSPSTYLCVCVCICVFDSQSFFYNVTIFIGKDGRRLFWPQLNFPREVARRNRRRRALKAHRYGSGRAVPRGKNERRSRFRFHRRW